MVVVVVVDVDVVVVELLVVVVEVLVDVEVVVVDGGGVSVGVHARPTVISAAMEMAKTDPRRIPLMVNSLSRRRAVDDAIRMLA